MKIYIAGKISGDPEYREKFDREAKEQIRAGNIVLNPAVLPEGLSKEEYMQICFQMIFTADKVVFLPEFLDSPGAMLEYSLCKYIGKETVFAFTSLPRTWMKEN